MVSGQRGTAAPLKVLITGASGFVGSRLAGRLLSDGWQVRGTHRRAAPPATPQIEWQPLSGLEDADALLKVMSGCDVVIHLAALVHQTGRAAASQQEAFERSNVAGTRLLARVAVQLGIRRLVFMSSVAAVCSRSKTCIDERTTPAPDSDYGRSKLQAERALQEELRGSAVDWCILRPPLVYGPGNPGNMERLMQLIARGLPLPFGAIDNRRSFIFIDNLVDAVARVMSWKSEIRSVFFVSDGSDFSTPQLIRELAVAARRSVRLWRLPVPLLELLGRVGDCVERLSGASCPIDSYSVQRVVESIAVNGDLFRSHFAWQAPVNPIQALRITGGASPEPGQ
jgi:nucleoside-diphosphate-sugar epimerase